MEGDEGRNEENFQKKESAIEEFHGKPRNWTSTKKAEEKSQKIASVSTSSKSAHEDELGGSSKTSSKSAHEDEDELGLRGALLGRLGCLVEVAV